MVLRKANGVGSGRAHCLIDMKTPFKLPVVVLLCASALFAGGARAADSLDDDLFLAPEKAEGEAAKVEPEKAQTSAWKGFAQVEVARTVSGDEHWSKARGRMELGRTGSFGQGLKWKVSGRYSYDLAYHWENDVYPSAVRRDNRTDFQWREFYLDVPLGNLELRLGRQHIVWGEMVGLFFADVVSARDMREFFLQDFDQMRTPQWAARAEYFKGDFHAEAIWIPYVSVDKLGRAGGDYYPEMPIPGLNAQYRYLGQDKPDQKLSNSNYGLRVGTLIKGWDLSGFYYRSLDVNPTFARTVSFGPTSVVTYAPRHDWIHQWGATLSKDFGRMVLKAEAVLTNDRRMLTSSFARREGLVGQDTVDYAVGLDFPLEDEARFNVQYFERYHPDKASDLLAKAHERGMSLLYNRKLGDRVEGEVMWVQSLARNDYMLRPKVIWRVFQNWQARFGADLFGGNRNGFFGRFDDSDRYYGELRYSF